jgi:hypothetical protein
MPSEYLTTSTNRPIDSLGGAYKIDSMTPWYQDPLIPEEIFQGTSASVSVGWDEEVSGIRLSHEVAFSTLAEAKFEDISILLLRLYCHILIGRIPDSGLKETGETLLQIQEFYQERLASDYSLLAEKSQFKGKWGRSYERPEFYASEE